MRVKIQVRINGEPAGDRDIEMVVASTLQLYPTASLYAKGTRVLSGFAAGMECVCVCVCLSVCLSVCLCVCACVCC